MYWNTLFFVILPYLAMAVFVVGHIWRWRADQFGWTTRTSELMEKRWLMWAAPLFHVSTLMVILGHLVGLLIPRSATQALGISDELYHLFAVGMGLLAGLMLAAGIAMLILRRFILKTRIRLITRPADAVLYVLLAVQIIIGLGQTFGFGLFHIVPGFDYRQNVSIWFRSLFYFNPDLVLISGAPLLFKMHIVASLAILAVWPFTRLVHVWSMPIGYLTRPPIVYRQKKTDENN